MARSRSSASGPTGQRGQAAPHLIPERGEIRRGHLDCALRLGSDHLDQVDAGYLPVGRVDQIEFALRLGLLCLEQVWFGHQAAFKLVLGGGKDVRGRGGGDLGGLDQATSGLQSVIGLGDLEGDCLVRGVEGEIGGELFAFGGVGEGAPLSEIEEGVARLTPALKTV